MAGRSRSRWFLDGVELLGARGSWGVEWATTRAIAARLPVRTSSARRHGARSVPGAKADVAKGVLSVWITSADPATGLDGGAAMLEANRDAVLARVGQFYKFGVLGVSHNGAATPSRVAEVEFSSAVEPSRKSGVVENWAFPFEVLGAFWRDPVPVVATSATLASLRGGTAPIEDAQFMCAGAGTSTIARVTDTQSGQWIEFSGSVPAGQYVRIDAGAESAFLVASSSTWSGGTEVAGLVTVGPGGFEVGPGVAVSMPAGASMRARRAFLV